LWDIRCAYKIKKWQTTSSANVVTSLNVLGEFEAIISLSTLHFNYPTWTFPEIKEEYRLHAEELGHPLIAPGTRVNNNFSFAEGKTIDVITGSNMAGKSTFLRTLGVNIILAYTGAPACSKKMELSLFKLVSYMRIKDSLNESTSTFKAEINRLKMILETTAREENSLALIDEMLRGTNSRDKYLGTKVFIERLIKQQSSAIIATHDLQIAELAQTHPRQIQNFNFDIQTDGVEMFFDYKLKTGECKTFNASILLKQIGLEIG
jgi:DNA mismatch repair ATPase MutS